MAHRKLGRFIFISSIFEYYISIIFLFQRTKASPFLKMFILMLFRNPLSWNCR